MVAVLVLVLSTWWLLCSGGMLGGCWVVPVTPVCCCCCRRAVVVVVLLAPPCPCPRCSPCCTSSSDIPAVLPTSSCSWQRGLVRRCPCLIAPCPHPMSSCSWRWLGVLLWWWPLLYRGSGGYWVVLVVLCHRHPCLIAPHPHPMSSCSQRWWLLSSGGGGYYVVRPPCPGPGCRHVLRCPVAPHFNLRATACSGGWGCCHCSLLPLCVVSCCPPCKQGLAAALPSLLFCCIVVISALDPTLRAEAHSGGREGLPHQLSSWFYPIVSLHCCHQCP